MARYKAEVTFGDDSIVRIINDNSEDRTTLLSFGDATNYLDIEFSSDYGTIQSLECIFQDNMTNLDLHLPGPESLKETEYAYILLDDDDDEENMGTFQLNVGDHELDILFSSNTNVYQFSKNDCVEYYYDDEYKLLYIKILNLSDDDYQYLLSQCNKKKINKSLYEENYVNNLIKTISYSENVSCVLGSCIGSQAWGYSTNDSDLDFRFVYVRPYKEYLSLNKPNDTIKYPITDKLDILGWDLSKFISLLLHQNVTAYEVLFSSMQYINNDYLTKLKEFSQEILDKDRISFQYINFIESLIEDVKNKSVIKTKLLLYILRMLGTVNYIQKQNKFPTCSLEEILKIQENKDLKENIEKIIHYRQNGGENLQVNNELTKFLDEEMLKCVKYKIIPQNKENKDINSANKLLIEGIEKFNDNPLEKTEKKY